MTLSFAPCDSCGALNRFDVTRANAASCGKCKRPLAVSGAVAVLTDAGLQRLIRSSPVPVVVDFWAPWCGPCRTFAPVFAGAAPRYAGSVAFGKLDTQAHPASSQSLGIRGIPTLIAFRDGAEVARQTGAMDARGLDQWVASLASGSESGSAYL